MKTMESMGAMDYAYEDLSHCFVIMLWAFGLLGLDQKFIFPTLRNKKERTKISFQSLGTTTDMLSFQVNA
jgi:hypothetical protein